jgi:hypothetical protein
MNGYPVTVPDGSAYYPCKPCDVVMVEEWDDNGRECWCCGALIEPHGHRPRPPMTEEEIEAMGYGMMWQLWTDGGIAWGA